MLLRPKPLCFSGSMPLLLGLPIWESQSEMAIAHPHNHSGINPMDWHLHMRTDNNPNDLHRIILKLRLHADPGRIFLSIRLMMV
jgi:hypothetical protein